ncbi:3,4-dioxygenase subunit beta [Intrasporangium sp.]|uniref:dioxygenase family protein n=1 Tax=Intrasporangium sp. TaxID=1925024 RepID=UPI003365348C
MEAFEEPDHPQDHGLAFDVATLLDRRRAMALMGGLGLAGALAACTPADPASRAGTATSATAAETTAATNGGTSATGGAALVEVPDETAGPFPGDGSNGQDVLDDSGIVRSDIRGSFGTSTRVADGVPLTIRITVKDAGTSQARVGAAVYVWHCDRDGNYSMYSSGAEQENYLRGVQVTDATGTVTFSSVYPGCYPGRWPHVHFEIYEGVDDATSSGPIVKTSQLALPQAACEGVYGTTGYDESLRNLSGLSPATDNVFGDDGGRHQLATMSGDNDQGWTAHLTIGV